MVTATNSSSSSSSSSLMLPPALRRSVKLCDLKLDHPNFINPRIFTGLDTDDLRAFGAEIKERGIKVAPMVQKVKVPSAPGGYINLVYDGQRRVKAARGVLEVDSPIEVIDRTPEPIDLTPEVADQIMLEALAIGANREGLSSYELSEVAERMKGRGRKLDDIAGAIRKSPSWISKMLKARQSATPDLMTAWKRSEITDEQFKDLAEAKEEKQRENVKQTVDLRKSGNKAEARTVAKETAATAPKPVKAAKPTKAEAKAAAKAAKPQMELPVKAATTTATTPKPVKKPAPSRLMLEEFASMAAKRPPTHDYVKGLVDGVRCALGDLDPKDFGKAWHVYLARVAGQINDHHAKVAKAAPKKPAKSAAKKSSKPAAKKAPKRASGKKR
jgi:hypothetical protein